MASGPVVAVNGVKLRCTSQACLESRALKETNIVVSKLRRRFSTLGWGPSTSAGISAACRSGVGKERVLLRNTCVSSANGALLFLPSHKTYPHRPLKCADGAPLFRKAYRMHSAGHALCYYGMESCLTTMASLFSQELQAEGFQYLCNDSLKLHQLGLNYLAPTRGPHKEVVSYASISLSAKAQTSDSDHTVEPSPCCVVLDIEGTTTPISFVTDVLFPYARDNVGRHLSATFETPETRDDIKLLSSQVDDDLRNGVHGAVPIPGDEAGKEEVIAALVSNVQAMIKADRKITALKQLQGHIWKTGFENNELEGVVFEDVPEALKKWHSLGIKVYIYSSGSRLAQRLIFGKTNFGDLRKYLCGFFDTNVGNKKETWSYVEISESLGVDRPSEILFVTDVYQEAIAAKAAGLEVLVSVRPGNGPLPENHGFKTINSFLEI